MENHSPNKIIPISSEQVKLLDNGLRIQILHLLEEPRTSKQVADLLGKSPGNVHYHIQKLLDGELLELVETRVVGSIMEKYYRSLGTAFRTESIPEYSYHPNGQAFKLATRLILSEDEYKQFTEELDHFFSVWENKRSAGNEFGVVVTVGQIDAGYGRKAYM